jgi:hypothetical protein
MIPDRIEYLLMLARDERAENDSLIDKQNELFAARAIRLLQLQELHEETGRILQEELKRFTRWMPKEHRTVQRQDIPERMPKVATLGPMPQMNPGGNLATKEK